MKTTRTSKKLLSVILSLLMVFSCMSAGFSAFAAEDEDPIVALAEALKNDTVKELSALTTVSNTSSGSGKNVNKTNTTAIVLPTYSQFTDVVTMLEKLDAAVKATSEWKNKNNPGNDSESRMCTNAGEIRVELSENLISSGAITTDEFAEYNVATLLENILSMVNVDYPHDNAVASGESTVPARVFDITTVTTDDYQGYLATKNAASEVESSITLGVKWVLTMSRESYSVTTGTGCNASTTNYHHSAVNTAHTEQGAVEVAATVSNTDAKTTIDAYDSYLDSVNFELTYEDMLNMVMDGSMQSAYDEFKGKYDAIVTYVGSVETFNKLFSRAAAVANMIQNMESAMDVETYLAVAKEWKEFADANPDYGVYNYGGFDYDEMVAAYNEFVEIYKALEIGGADLMTYLNKYGHISTEYYSNFTDNVVVYDLKALAEDADALYDENKDTHATLKLEEQTAVLSTLTGYINAVGNYSEQVVNSIYPDGYKYLTDLADELHCETNEYVVYFVEVTNTSYIDKKTSDIENVVNESESKLAGLHEFYAAEIEALGSDRAYELLGAVVEAADAFAEKTMSVLADRFTAEVDYAYNVWQTLGAPTAVESVSDFIKLKVAFGGLETGILEFLAEKSSMELISDETIEKYNKLIDVIYAEYKEFAETFGFAVYSQTELTYISREVYSNDVLKTEAYDVTSENLEAVIEKLDSFITGADFASLTGLDLEKTITGVTDMIYSDKIVNLVVQYLYPLIANEFIKVWDGIDPVMQQPGSKLATDLNSNIVTIYLNLDSVEKATESAGLYLFPTTLASHISEIDTEGDYEQVVEKLSQCITKASSGRNPWKDVNIVNTDGNLDLKWGVTDRASFIKAVDMALSGLEPLLLALLSSKEMDSGTVKIGNATAEGATANILSLSVDLTISAVTLSLTASANDGYNNTLAPVLEALGLTAPDGNTFTSTADFVEKGLLEPVEALLKKLAANPVDTLLALLPNISYALGFDMIDSLLKMLKTNIAYAANADYSYRAAGGIASGSGTAKNVLASSVPINVGGMIGSLSSLGLDLSNGLNSLFALLGINLPDIDSSTLATLGELKTIETMRSDWIYDNTAIGDKAYTIAADKADVGYFLLTYIVELLKDKDAFASLLGKFLEEDKVGKVIGIIDALDFKSTGDVIAAAVELLTQEKYDEAEFVYPEISNSTPIVAEETFYSVYWTKDRAEYVSDNLVPFVEKIFDIAGFDISDELNNMLAQLYTRDNVVALTELVNGLLDDATINNVLKVVSPLLSVDASGIVASLVNYEVPEFEDGDRDAFAAAIVDYITPAVPVLKLFLIDDSTLTLANTINVYGYNGYNSAVVPILEGIGCPVDSVTPYDTFKTLDDKAMVNAVIDPILDLLDATLAEDPINNIIALLPNILYFIDNGGLQQAVDNLLRPVYAVLDTIRPVKDINIALNLNLTEILTDLLAGVTEGASIKFPGYSDLSDIVKMLGTETTYTSATGKQAVKLVVDSSLTPEFVTSILRLVVKTVMFDDNVETILGIVNENSEFSDEAKEDVANFLYAVADLETDHVLFVLYCTFFGLNAGVDGVIILRSLIADEILEALNKIGLSSSNEFRGFVDTISDLMLQLTQIADDTLKTENAFTSFFKQLFDTIRRMIDKFLSAFKL